MTNLTAERQKFRLFISYSHHEKEFVKNVHAACEKAGYRIWRDEEKLRGSVDQCLVKGIEASHAVIICLSSQYLESEYGERELTFACKIKKHIKPVIVDPKFVYMHNSVYAFRLKNRLYTNLALNNFQEEMNKVIDEIDEMLGLDKSRSDSDEFCIANLLNNNSISVHLSQFISTVVSNNKTGKVSVNISDNLADILHSCLAYECLQRETLDLMMRIIHHLNLTKAAKFQSILENVCELIKDSTCITLTAAKCLSHLTMNNRATDKLLGSRTFKILMDACKENDSSLQEYSLRALSNLTKYLRAFPKFLENDCDIYALIVPFLDSSSATLRKYSHCLIRNLCENSKARRLMINMDYIQKLTILCMSEENTREKYVYFIVSALSKLSSEDKGAEIMRNIFPFEEFRFKLRDEAKLTSHLINIFVNVFKKGEFPEAIIQNVIREFRKDKERTMPFVQNFSKCEGFVSKLCNENIDQEILKLLVIPEYTNAVFETIFNISQFATSEDKIADLMKNCILYLGLNVINPKTKAFILSSVGNFIENPSGRRIFLNTDCYSSILTLFEDEDELISHFAMIVIKNFIKKNSGKSMVLKRNILFDLKRIIEFSSNDVDITLLEIVEMLISVNNGRNQALTLNFPSVIDAVLQGSCNLDAKEMAIRINKCFAESVAINISRDRFMCVVIILFVVCLSCFES